MSAPLSGTTDLSLAASQATAGRLTLPDAVGLSDAKARRAAEDFEAVFISEMMKPIFESVSTEGPFGGGPAEGIWRSMMVTEIGKEIARRGGFGIADNVHAEMLRLQEANR